MLSTVWGPTVHRCPLLPSFVQTISDILYYQSDTRETSGSRRQELCTVWENGDRAEKEKQWEIRQKKNEGTAPSLSEKGSAEVN